MNALTITKIEDVELGVSADAVTIRDQAIAEADFITEIADNADGAAAVEALKGMKRMLKNAEDSRVEIKRPVLDLDRRIQAFAAAFSAPLEKAYDRLNGLVTAWQAAEKKKAEAAERARQGEIKRIEEERERVRREEADRQAALKKAEDDKRRAEAEAKRATDAEEKRAAQARADAAEAERRKQVAAVQDSRAEHRELVAQASVMVPVPVSKPTGLVNKAPWKFEVVNIGNLFQARGDLCNIEASKERINDAIRSGMRECPGLRIWQEATTEVRV